MERYLLDTNVISELRKPKPHGAVVAWLRTLNVEQLFLSAVTLGEIQSGIELVRLQDRSKALEIEQWAAHLTGTMQILPMDSSCFREWAKLMHGRSRHNFEDVMIAATARVHSLTIATRNEKDFKFFDVPGFNPFK